MKSSGRWGEEEEVVGRERERVCRCPHDLLLGNREDYRTTTLLLLLLVVVVVVVVVVVEAVVVGGAGPWTRYPVQGPLSPLALSLPSHGSRRWRSR